VRITFLLPGAGREPIGGFKIVYEYANGLTRRGHHVTLIHTASHDRDPSMPVRIRRAGAYLKQGLRRDVGPARWFKLDPRVRVKWVPSLAPTYVPDGDAVLATAWQTAEWVAEYPAAKGRKLYFIQHLETWSGPEERVMATWKLPLEKIVSAKWLQSIAASLGEPAVYIPLGLDFDAFDIDVPPEQRAQDSFLMLHHTLWWKGTRDGMGALKKVQARYPGASIVLFGTGAHPTDLPEGFAYEKDPAQSRLRTLYNEAAIFVAPSVTEGWGLPATEAMMCGAALAATDNGGHREFAIAGETALISEPQDPDALAENLFRLVENRTLRIEIARRGREFVQQFTWDRAFDRFEEFLKA
jgi:glycosyltransferase involved in cell wall biosynthesis